jgi:hypothetical protein
MEPSGVHFPPVAQPSRPEEAKALGYQQHGRMGPCAIGVSPPVRLGVSAKDEGVGPCSQGRERIAYQFFTSGRYDTHRRGLRGG